MIFDNIKNANLYAGLHPKFKEAFEFIEKNLANPPDDGKYILDGDNLYSIVTRYSTKENPDIKYEAHDKYIDIQFIVRGKEICYVKNREALQLNKSYDANDDYALYDFDCSGTDGSGTPVHLSDCEFVILYPWDAHIPAVIDGDSADNLKFIMKVKMR